MPVKKISGILIKIIACALILVGLLVLLLLMPIPVLQIVGFIVGGILILVGILFFVAGRKLFKS